MELYIFRHGKTVWNTIRKIQGHSDIELTDQGREVARRTSEAIKDIHFDAIYSSPLKRAYETARILRGDGHLEIKTDDRLMEIGFGVMEGAHCDKLTELEPGSPFHMFFNHPELYPTPEGGESFDDITDRARGFLKDLVRWQKDSDRVMIVAHGAMNKALLRVIRNLELKDYWKGMLQKNCGVTIVKYDGSNYEMIEESKVFYSEE